MKELLAELHNEKLVIAIGINDPSLLRIFYIVIELQSNVKSVLGKTRSKVFT